jgi:DNA-binding SARP family transcriptional activator
MAAEEIGKMARSPSASPLLLVTWKWLEALMYNRSAESHDLSVRSISEGLEIAQKNGIHVWDHMLFGQGVYASFNKRDMRLANEFLKKMETTLQSRRRHGLCQYHYLTGWYHLLNDHIPLAAQSAETAEKLARETGMIFTEILCALLKGQVWYEEGEYPKARAQLAHAKKLSHKTRSRILDYMCLIREAQFYLMGDDKTKQQGVKALRDAMELGRKHGYIDLFPWWQPSVIADLCAKAIDSGIEVDYAQDLIRKHRLAPAEPPLAVANWPWPLKINTLGKFELYKDGAPLTFSRKVQKKPLLLLKAVIALGGRDIKEEQITDLIWPDSEGDAAHNAFKTTLSRLRHLIGEEVILLQEGKASLNPSSCWVDTTVFELISRRADVFLRRSRDEEDSGELRNLNEAMALAKMAMDVYRGHFLAFDEDQAWTTPYRERLRNRYLSLVTRLGEYLKETGNWEKALEVFQRALEIDPFAEEIYQQLMICYRHLNEHAEAVTAYERCKKTLHASGIQPSAKTEAIYRTVRNQISASGAPQK